MNQRKITIPLKTLQQAVGTGLKSKLITLVAEGHIESFEAFVEITLPEDNRTQEVESMFRQIQQDYENSDQPHKKPRR